MSSGVAPVRWRGKTARSADVLRPRRRLGWSEQWWGIVSTASRSERRWRIPAAADR